MADEGEDLGRKNVDDVTSCSDRLEESFSVKGDVFGYGSALREKLHPWIEDPELRGRWKQVQEAKQSDGKVLIGRPGQTDEISSAEM